MSIHILGLFKNCFSFSVELETFFFLTLWNPFYTYDWQLCFTIFFCLFFIPLIAFLYPHIFSVLMKSNISIFCCFCCAFGVTFKKPLPRPGSCRFAPMFPSKSFIVLGLLFWSLIHFELIYESGVCEIVPASLFCMKIYSFPSIDTVLSLWMVLALVWKFNRI